MEKFRISESSRIDTGEQTKKEPMNIRANKKRGRKFAGRVVRGRVSLDPLL
mgnify:CR=1 FL=1